MDLKFYLFRLWVLGLSLYTLNSSSYSWSPFNICSASYEQYYPQLVSDGQGGAIITWQDEKGVNPGIYVQRVSHVGQVLWDGNGIYVSIGTNSAFRYFSMNPQLVSDGQGGAIIAWMDYRNTTDTTSNIYAQKVNSSGSTLWASSGIVVCTALFTQSSQILVSDDSGGSIILWQDSRDGNADIYAQRVNSNGATLWYPNGIAICTANNDQSNLSAISDGLGGAIIVWVDYRNDNGSLTNSDIYAQHVNSSGSTLWLLNGIVISTSANQQTNPHIVSDGADGCIITWEDGRDTSATHIYAQRLNGTGNKLWINNGVPICLYSGGQYNPISVSDGTGGAVITWFDERDSTGSIYAQRINNRGLPLWDLNGALIASVYLYLSSNLNLVSDSTGGAIISWFVESPLSEFVPTPSFALIVERVNSVGSTLWLNFFGEEPLYPQQIPDGSGGTLLTWANNQGYPYPYIHIQAALIDADGNYIPPTAPSELIANLISYNQVKLTWTDTSTDENGFGIDFSIGTSAWQVLDFVGANSTTYTYSNLFNTRQYCFRVYAWNGAGISSYSNEACITTPTSIKNDQWMFFP